MKYINLFEAFTQETQQYLETNKLIKGIPINKAVEAKSRGMIKPQNDILTRYIKDIKDLITSDLTGKVYKVPEYGMVKPAAFKFGEYEDVYWGCVGKKSGAGFVVDATRTEKAKAGTGFPKCSFFIDVFYDIENLRANFYNAYIDKSPQDVINMIKLGPDNFGGYSFLYKKVGNQIDFENSPIRYTMQQLGEVDIKWGVLFGKLADIAAKYASKK
jgi:hypothetical protein